MTEYIKRYAGGFYIVEESRGSKLLTVRRAVHQIIDPKTEHPFPEIPLEEQFSRQLWDEPLQVNYSNDLPTEVNLSEEYLRRAALDLIRTLEWQP